MRSHSSRKSRGLWSVEAKQTAHDRGGSNQEYPAVRSPASQHLVVPRKRGSVTAVGVFGSKKPSRLLMTEGEATKSILL